MNNNGPGMRNKRKVGWKVRRRAFHLWQLRPHQVAPLATVAHVCACCDTQYEGNFCPRCGQSAQIGRFSFKVASRLFIDVWGLGNRGMFRTIRDLLLRPGYMIRDYLRGMQSAYFPPFKLYFLLTTFSLLVTHGLWSTDEKVSDSPAATPVEQTNAAVEAPADTLNVEIVEKVEETAKTDKEIDKEEIRFQKFVQRIGAFEDNYPNVFSFLVLLLVSVPLFLFFRHCPAIPDLRFSELVVALTYMSCMCGIYSIIGDVLHLSGVFGILEIIATIVALRQFSGFKYPKLIVKTLLSFGILFIALVLMVIAVLTTIRFTN